VVGVNSGQFFDDISNGDAIAIGALPYDGTSHILPFYGVIDEVAVYDYPLTPQQIATHHAWGALQGYKRAVRASLPVAYWRLGDSEPVSDPNFPSVVFLVPGNGAVSGAVFTDYSQTPHSISRVGQVHTTDAQFKYYGTSIYFDGSSDYLRVPNHADFRMADQDFTAEAWVYPTAYPTGGSWSTIFSDYSDSPQNGWRLLIGEHGTLGLSNSTGEGQLFENGVPLNVWTHVAASVQGGVLRLFINGAQVGGFRDDWRCTNGSNSYFFIGTTNGSTWHFKGYMQDLRITKGIGRYGDGGFAAPSPLYDVNSGGPIGAAEAADETGNHPGAYVGGVTYQEPTLVPASDDDAITLDGSSGYVGTTWDGVLGVGALTVEAWVKTNNTLQAQLPILVWGGGGIAPGDGIYFALADGGRPKLAIYGAARSSLIDVRDGQAHHIVATIPANGAASDIKVFIDGSDQSGTVVNAAVAKNTTQGYPVSLGLDVAAVGAGGTENLYFPGGIDEVAIYDRALTDDEVLSHYLSGTVLVGVIFDLSGTVMTAGGAAADKVLRHHLRRNRVPADHSRPLHGRMTGRGAARGM